MPIESPETRKPTTHGLQYSLRDLFLYFLAITLLISGYTTSCSGMFNENGAFFIVRASPVIAGILIYFIGVSNRRDMNYAHFTPFTRFILISILLISGFFLSYLLWAHIRISSGKVDYFQPGDWPYPDKVIIKLDYWLNLNYTVGPPQIIFDEPIHNGSIKVENLEYLRVNVTQGPHITIFRHILFTLEIIMGPFILIAAWCLGLLVPFRLEWLDKLKSICKRCLMRR